MSRFDRELTGFRFVDTNHGDTLQDIALRELGDASRWVDLISYNNLVPPFITDDAALVRKGVILTGQQIIVPAPGRRADQTDSDAVLGADAQLGPRGELLTDGFDFAVVSGRANLSQAIRMRVTSERGDLMYHPEYGCDVRRLLGVVNGPTKGLIAARVSKAAVAQDPRVTRVTQATALVVADTINIAVECETIAGRNSASVVQV